MTIGIYIIRNRETGLYYFGSTMNCEKRLREHLRDLRNGKHNWPLQCAWNKYGEAAFDFIVNHCPPDTTKKELQALEQIYLDALRPWLPERGYNVDKLASRAWQDSEMAKRRTEAVRQAKLVSPQRGRPRAQAVRKEGNDGKAD